MLYLVLVMHVLDRSGFCELHRQVDQYVAFASQDRSQAEEVMHHLEARGRQGYYEREVRLVECPLDQPIGVRALHWEVSYVE